ncbi:MAG: hypothetical protein VKI83_08700 [Synechococcaceae cyanobacterium]|nr:hypothetical protein [Synechococcaceae cyanobacterium]
MTVRSSDSAQVLLIESAVKQPPMLHGPHCLRHGHPSACTPIGMVCHRHGVMQETWEESFSAALAAALSSTHVYFNCSDGGASVNATPFSFLLIQVADAFQKRPQGCPGKRYFRRQIEEWQFCWCIDRN